MMALPRQAGPYLWQILHHPPLPAPARNGDSTGPGSVTATGAGFTQLRPGAGLARRRRTVQQGSSHETVKTAPFDAFVGTAIVAGEPIFFDASWLSLRTSL
jgi:hypothetical protein